ncbi:MAG: patatin-like phospholipase family protein [Chloroflexi bacterium]|nr:patatin-like phospholipase family protein [Chloroflexota bacterium]
MADSNSVSRADILLGRLSLERRAARVLGTVEARVAHMRTETRHAVQALFSGREDEFTRTFGDDYLRSLKMTARFADAPRVEDIERFARHWRPLVPPEPEVRAAVIQAMNARYGVSPGTAPLSFESMGYGDPAVGEAYQRLFGAALDAAALPGREEPTAAAVTEDGDLENQALRDAEAALDWLSVPAGTVLMREGDQPDYLYFVISGRLRVAAGYGREQRVIADLGRGELVGEIGVLTGEPRTANVTAMRDSEVVRLPQAEVLRMAHQSPQMLLRVNHILAQRLRVELSPRHRTGSSQLTLAVVGLSPGVPVRELAARLVEELAALGPVAHVSRDRAEGEFPRLRTADPSQDGELLAWLSEQEARHQFVVFEADREPGQWTDLCIRQADRIALVADESSGPALTPAEERVAALNGSARRELVILRPSTEAHPNDTRRWLGTRQVAAHHNVVLAERAHVARFARRLVGQAIGLVLGGGGVRGYAHIGAWRAFEEAGIAVDTIGGTSVGAIVAAGIATDRDAEAMERLGRTFAEGGITDLTLPMVSFFQTRKLTSLLRKHTENLRIEDLWRPFFCISTSLTRAEPVVHSEGPLWRAARASSAIPGLFAPVTGANGDLLVDGGIMNNVPVDSMRAACERGPVIAINLSPQVEHSDDYRLGPSVSGWRILWSRLNPLVKPIQAPSIFTTLLRTTEAGSIHRMRTGQVLGMADLLINPPMEKSGLLDFRNYDGLVKVGYEATKAALDQWLAENPELKQRLGVKPA